MLPFIAKNFNLLIAFSLPNPPQASFHSHHSTETILVSHQWPSHDQIPVGSLQSSLVDLLIIPFMKLKSRQCGRRKAMSVWCLTLFPFVTQAMHDSWQKLHYWMGESECLLIWCLANGFQPCPRFFYHHVPIKKSLKNSQVFFDVYDKIFIEQLT